MDTSVSTPQAIATVVSVEGQAFARDPAGEMRPLNAGDVLREGDTIVTMPGGQVQLAFMDGHLITLLPSETFQFSAETSQTSRPEVAEASLPAGEANRVIQALARGENIDDLLDPTAAGLEGGGENTGNDFVRLLRIVEGVSTEEIQFSGGASQEGILQDNNPNTLAGLATSNTIPVTSSNVATLTSATASLTETNAVLSTGGTLVLTDPDAIPATVVAQTATVGSYGSFSIDANGVWSYTTSSALDALQAGQVVTEVFTVATSDGGSASVAVTIAGPTMPQ